ncbi:MULTISPECIES: YheC/YheD family protein [Bacillaceae]|uniref:YheC/YheD family endospore coat-associated protein n=1 Tax=Bacillaceae TaxID=186817 RepID=UPI001C5A00B6|nr:YheC/YheD family protein [Rossellomorea sp. YZS02]MBW3110626.1 YheC/YheD family protein [Bacillus sp. MCCB 382]MDX8343396.1 YheC/YheD family protein [Rossellomorea sp. YZS02]
MNHSLGIMTLVPQVTNEYFLEIANHSLSYPIDLYLFSPQGISPLTETVEGHHFDRVAGKWEKDVFDIPDFIYDRTYYQHDLRSRQARAVVQWMKNQKHIRFLGYGLPNKWHLYEKLSQTSLSPYIPETFLVSDGPELLNLLSERKDIIIKPVDGAHGFAVYHLEAGLDEIKVRTTKKHGIIEQSFQSDELFLKWAEHILKQHTFICQNRLLNHTKEGSPFDMRILLNKDGNGEWREFQRAVRVGEANGILTNISRGASYLSCSDWKSTHDSVSWDFIEQELLSILEHIPILLEEQFSPLFEIGVDLIIAQDQSLWILDMNSKPGHKVVNSLQPDKLSDLYRAPLEYCTFLSSQSLSSLRRGDF